MPWLPLEPLAPDPEPRPAAALLLLPVLGHYADWKIYVAYDVLAAAVFAAVLGGLNFRQYRIAVPLATICWFAPGF